MKNDRVVNYAEQFLSYVARSGKFSANTLDAYRNDVYKFIHFLEDNNVNSFINVNGKIAAKYLTFLKENLKERSVMRNISSLKNLFNYLKRERLFRNKNPFSDIRFKGVDPRVIATLSVPDVEKLTKALHSEGFIESRNKAMVLFIYNTGLRASEISEALLNNLDLKKATYTCVNGNVKRVIPFSKKLVPVLKSYLKERENLMKKRHIPHNSGNKYLFVNRRGGKITRQTVYIVVQKKADEAKLHKDVTPSILRNSLALHLLSSGSREDVVKSILGYTTIVPKYTYSPNIGRTKFEFLSTHPAFRKR